MGLVDEQRVRRALGLTVPPDVGFQGPPNLRVEAAGLLILQHAAGPSGQAVASSAGPANLEPIGIAVREHRLGKLELPDALATGSGERIARTRLPVGEGSLQVNRKRARGPLTKQPVAVLKAKPKVLVSGCQSRQVEPSGRDAISRRLDLTQPSQKDRAVRRQQRIPLNQAVDSLLRRLRVGGQVVHPSGA
jgi:hypothetical protein